MKKKSTNKRTVKTEQHPELVVPWSRDDRELLLAMATNYIAGMSAKLEAAQSIGCGHTYADLIEDARELVRKLVP